MGFFGQEFIEIRSVLRAPGSPVSLDVPLLVSEIERRLRDDRHGAILYFEPGDYLLIPRLTSYAPWDGDWVIPYGATLWFERGARIVLAGSRLVLHGGIVAPRMQVFREDEGALVLFAGNPDALLPEWWGASPSIGVDSTDAIQRAIDAASARRMPVANGVIQAARRPIPVLLHERYFVTRPVELGRSREVPMRPGSTGVSTFGIAGQITTMLRGVNQGTVKPSAGLLAGPSVFAGRALRQPGESTLSRDPHPPSERPFRALIDMVRAQGSIVEDIIVDGSLLADQGVVIEGGVTPDGAELQSYSVALRNCTIMGARLVQVQVGSPRLVVSREGRFGNQLVPIEANPRSGADLLGLAIEGCDIVCRTLQDSPFWSIGIQLRALNGVAIRISNCTFRGSSAAFIDATAIVALIEGCDFQNDAAPALIFSYWGGKSLNYRGTEEPSACDVYLGVEGSDRTAARVQPQAVTSAVAVVGCRSRSERFFSTPSPSPFIARPTRSNLIYGVQHVPASERLPPEWVRRTSVYWGRGRLSQFAPHAAGSSPPANRDASLCVVGSSLTFGMKVGVGAAQSVVLACAMPRPEARLQFIPAQPETPDDHRIAISATTIIFGFALMAIALVGCLPPAAPNTGIDAARASLDASVDRGEVGRGAREDADVRDFSAYFDRALRDVPRRDISVPPLNDVPLVTDLPPPSQGRQDCEPATDGDPTIAPPRLIFPLSPLRVTSRRPRVVWELASGTHGARIEFCRDRCCTQVIETVDTLGTFATPTAMLPPGAVFWRARGRLGDRTGRETSFTWEFGVRHGSAPVDTAWGSIRDINGDGYDDLAASLNGDSSGYIRFYWGGSGGLSPSRHSTISTATPAAPITFGDFNGDGYADVATRAVTHPRELRGSIMIAYGSMSGAAISGSAVATGVGSLAVTDVNGDGFSDVITASYGGSADAPLIPGILTFFGSATGLGAGGRQELTDPAPRPNRRRFGVLGAAGDLNGDGYGDVLVGDPGFGGDDFSGAGRVYVFRGGPGGLDAIPYRIFEVPDWEHGTPGFGSRIHDVGDLNGDRLMDVVVCELYRNSALVYSGHPTEYLRYERLLEGRWPPYDWEAGRAPRQAFGEFATIGADLTGDGFAELVLPCEECVDPGEREKWWRQRGRAYIFDRHALASGVPLWAIRPAPVNDPLELLGGLGTDVCSADYDGDGFDDLAVGTSGDWFTYEFGGGMIVRRGGPSFHPSMGVRIIEDDLPAGAFGLGRILE